MALALEQRSRLAERGLGMQRGDLNPQLANLLVGDRREAPPLDDQLAVGAAGAEQAERTVADAANHAAGGVGFADLAAEHVRLPEVERRSPAASEVDDVVSGEIDVRDAKRAGQLFTEDRIVEQAIVFWRPDLRFH